MRETTPGIGIVGAGMVARTHARAITAAGARLVAVCRSSAALAAESAREHGVPCEVGLDALLRRPDVEIVAICTPSGLHAEQAIAAARAGKHVLVEKPLALTVADADAMITACREAGVRLGVSFQRRTVPAVQALREAVAAGALGRLTLGTVSVPYFRGQDYYDSAAWRGTWALDGGGALMNQGIHLVDLLLWLMGDVEEVQARFTTAAHTIEVEDCVTASLRFRNGALGTLLATTAAAPGFPHRVEIYGAEGGVQIEGEDVVRWSVPGRPAPENGPPRSADGSAANPAALGVEGHARLIADFVEAVRSGRDPMVSGEEGRRSLALVLAVYEAARQGRPVSPA